jgi:copper chaperone CopZ
MVNRVRSSGANPMVQKTELEHSKSKDRLRSEAHAILSYVRPGLTLPSGKLERHLRKLEGIEEVTINHLGQTVKIRYNPSMVTIEEIRSFLKELSPHQLGNRLEEKVSQLDLR